MLRRTWIMLTILLTIMLLAGCNLPLGQATATLPVTETVIPVVASEVTETETMAPTAQETASTTSGERMVAPADVKLETLPAGEYQKTAPDGYRKLLVYPIGGWEGSMGSCEGAPATPSFAQPPTEIQALVVDPDKTEFLSCGWQTNETVNITLTRPDGSQERSSQVNDGGMDIFINLPMEYGMLLGDYSYTFQAPSGKITQNFKVVYPTEPGMVKTDVKKYFVFGFEADEHVYVLAYKKADMALQLSTWREVTVDARGEMLLDAEFGADFLAVVGDSSGKVWSNWLLGMFVGDNMFYTQVGQCSGAPKSRLQPFSFAYVTDGVPNNVRSKPSKSASLEGKIVSGTVVIVGRSAPVCADGLLWWQVDQRDGKGPRGWTAEGSGSDYWLAPLE